MSNKNDSDDEKLEEAKFSLDDLIKMAGEIQAKHAAENPHDLGLRPLELLYAMSAQMLAAYIPQHSKALLAREHPHIEQTFALDMLRLHDQPASMFIGEERQNELFGGIEPMLFERLPAGIFDHYSSLMGRKREDDDPLNWEFKDS